MNTLIVKLGATGDVVRTSVLLRHFEGQVTWITSAKNQSLLENVPDVSASLRVLPWENRASITGESFDLTINLEDDLDTASILKSVDSKQIFGACVSNDGRMTYTPDAASWFDLSLISVHGREKADALKYRNRSSYQDLIFGGLGLKFTGQKYVLPGTDDSDLTGDVAIAPEAGPVWPMKKWAHYDRLKLELERRGFRVNYLPVRKTLLEHLADVRGHRCLVSGDSLPMHLAIGSNVPCLALFNCTSPWEIYDYGILKKLISPLIGEFFYKRGFDERATTAIPFDEVLDSVLGIVNSKVNV